MSSSFWDEYYPGFTRDPSATIHDEFARLATHRGWRNGSKRYRKAYSRCMREEFNRHYGSDANRLEGWQMLCADVGITNIPGTVTQCKKALRRVWVNLVDLVDCRNSVPKRVVARHRSQMALREYIKETSKIFPKEAAKANGFLSVLLIEVF